MTLFILDAGVHDQFIFFTIKLFEESVAENDRRKIKRLRAGGWRFTEDNCININLCSVWAGLH